MSSLTKKEARQRRHRRVRAKVSGTAAKPRMSVCATGKHIYVQFIDDSKGVTVAAASTLDRSFRESGLKANLAGAAALGKTAAERAMATQISEVVFDRGGLKYHGRVKAVADAARQTGLKF